MYGPLHRFLEPLNSPIRLGTRYSIDNVWSRNLILNQHNRIDSGVNKTWQLLEANIMKGKSICFTLCLRRLGIGHKECCFLHTFSII